MINNKIYNVINRYVRLISVKFAVVAEVAAVLMMLLTAADVFMRYILNSPLPGAYELIEYLGAIFVAAGIAFCAVRKGHVDVDIIVTRFSPRTQNIIAGFGGLISFGIFALVSWQSFVHIGMVYRSDLMSPILHIPTYPFYILVGFGCALLSLIILIETIESISKVVHS